MLHFKNTSSDRSLSDILALFGRSTMPPWLKTLSTGALEAGMANVRCTAGISLSYVALLRTQCGVLCVHVVCEQLLPLWWWFINIILS